MLKKITVYKLNRLKNHDFTRAYKLIVSQLEGEEFLVEDVQTAYTSICAHNEKLTSIKNGEAKHELTETMSNLTDLRHQYVLSLRGRVVYSRKSPFADERDAANKLYRWLEKEQKFLRRRSINSQAKSIDNMMDTLNDELGLQDALTTLGLNELFTTITNTSVAIDNAFKERTADQAALKKKTRLLRDNAYDAMQVFIVALEQTIALSKGDVERSRFNMNEIDRVVTTFASKYDSDVTRKKNAEEAQKEREEGNSANGGARKIEGPINSMKTPKIAQPKSTTMSGPYSVLNKHEEVGMDLQKGDSANASLTPEPLAMSESETNSNVLAVEDDKAKETTTGNGDLLNAALDDNPQNGATDMRQGRADVDNNSDQEE